MLPLRSSDLATVDGFVITKDLLIMVVFAFLMIATLFDKKNRKHIESRN
jgi:hypothetical protein